ncbi:flippase [Paenibacillus terrigena]|uniref:flippase n=1 Tax=Paenibacillus terrigena TaxID=369333 RepID=UPI00036FA869|nr:flippase [Paenibacillus terrigena]
MRIRKSKVFNNISWILAERIVQLVIALFVGIMSARFLGPSNFGLINYSISIMSLFFAFCELGIADIFIRDVLNEPSTTGVRLGSGIMMRFIAGFISMILMIVTVIVIDPTNEIVIYVSIVLSFSLIFRSIELIDSWFQSRLQSKYVSISKILTGVCIAIWKISLLMMNAPVIWFAFSTTLEAMLVSAILLFMYVKKGGVKWEFSMQISKGMLSQSYHLIISGLLVSLYTKLGQIMIGSMIGEVDVGIYSAAIRLSDMWYIIPLAIINSVTPVIIEQRKHDYEAYIRKLKQLYAVIIWMGIGVGIIFSIFSLFIVHTLYGEAYSRAAGVLNINIWAGTFAMLGSARSIWIVCENYQKYVKHYIIFGTVINVVLNWILIPKLGIYGASWSTLIAQIVVAIIAPLFYKRTRASSLLMFDALLLRGVLQQRVRSSAL